MRKYGYKRSSATLMVRRRPVRRKKPSSFFKSIFSLLLIVAVACGAFVGVRYAYYTVKNAQLTDWHVKSVVVDGLSGTCEKEIFTRISSLEGKPFSTADADKLRGELIADYPTLTKISVSRGLLSGKLTVSAQPRQPVARFVLPDNSRKYVDEESVVYADPQETREVLEVKLVGEAPAKLESSFVDLVQSLLKLKKSLPFESLEFNVTNNTVTMGLPDQSIIRFGQAIRLKEKVRRAAQIMTIARKKHTTPVELDFTFFEKGKVFLTQTPH